MSSEMALFDGLHITSYYWSVATTSNVVGTFFRGRDSKLTG